MFLLRNNRRCMNRKYAGTINACIFAAGAVDFLSDASRFIEYSCREPVEVGGQYLLCGELLEQDLKPAAGGGSQGTSSINQQGNGGQGSSCVVYSVRSELQTEYLLENTMAIAGWYGWLG